MRSMKQRAKIERVWVIFCSACLLVALLSLRLLAFQSLPWTSPAPGWLYIFDGGKASSSDAQLLLVDPTTEAIRGRVPMGLSDDQPEVALSPDGAKLFSLQAQVPGGSYRLLTISIATGQIMGTVPSPQKMVFTVPVHLPSIVPSLEGNWVYMSTVRATSRSSVDDVYSIYTFDTNHNAFLPDAALIPGCGRQPLMLPLPRKLELDVVCPASSSFHHLVLRDDGGLQSSLKTSFAKPAIWTQGSLGQALKTAAIINNRVVLFMGDGHLFTQSNAGTSLSDQGLIPNVSIGARYVTVSPDGTKLYVVGGKETATGDYTADQIVALDTASLRPLGVISPGEPFFDIALSKDGRYIYAQTPAATVLVIDTLNPTAIRKISGLGAAPVGIMVAP